MCRRCNSRCSSRTSPWLSNLLSGYTSGVGPGTLVVLLVGSTAHVFAEPRAITTISHHAFVSFRSCHISSSAPTPPPQNNETKGCAFDVAGPEVFSRKEVRGNFLMWMFGASVCVSVSYVTDGHARPATNSCMFATDFGLQISEFVFRSIFHRPKVGHQHLLSLACT